MSFLLGTFLQSIQRSVFTVLVRFRDVFYKLVIVLLTSTVIVWLSVFLYGFFYYTYMPAVSHVKPVYLQFRWCDNESICDFPSANVTLSKRSHEHLLMRGQQYKVYLDLEMPESPTNQQLGMFMVNIEFMSRTGQAMHTSSRSAMFRYKSPLHQTLVTLFFTPLLILGSAEEKQMVSLELCDYYEEDPNRPAAAVRIVIRHKRIDIYSAQLRIYAHFTGLRYLMFHWPVTSAIVGIGTNLFFLSVVALLSWYRYLVSHESHEVVVRVGFDDNRAAALEKRRSHVKEFLMREKQRQSRLKASFSSFDVLSTTTTAAATADSSQTSSSSTVGGDKDSPERGGFDRTHSLGLLPSAQTLKKSTSSPAQFARRPRTFSESSVLLSPSDMEVIDELGVAGPSSSSPVNDADANVDATAAAGNSDSIRDDDESEESDLLQMADIRYDPAEGDAAEKTIASSDGVFTSAFRLGPLRKRSFVHQVTL